MIAGLLRDIHTLSLERSSHPPSPSISPHLSQLQGLGHSPNILVTSPTSPSPFPPLHGTSHSHPTNRAGLPTLMIPTVPAYALHTPSSSPTAADLPGSCFGGGRGFGTRAHGHSSQPSITLTPDDDNEHSKCKRARMEGTVGVEGNSGVGVGIGMGVTGTGRNKMDMTTDSEEDSKLHRPVSLTGTPCSRPRSDSASVWAIGGDGGLSGNSGAAAAASWGRGRSGSNYGR